MAKAKIKTTVDRSIILMDHTVEWLDGLKVTRVMVHEREKQIVLWVTWQGVKREIRLGKRVGEMRRIL